MGLMIKGEFTPEEIASVENLGPKDFWTVVNLPEEAETYGAEPCAYYERGDEAIRSAISLLELIDTTKSKELDAIRESVVQPTNKYNEATYLITLENAKRIYELIREIPDNWSKICDWKWALQQPFDETVEQIDRTLYRIESGEKLIDMSAGQVEQLIKFLELAIKKQRDVWLSY